MDQLIRVLTHYLEGCKNDNPEMVTELTNAVDALLDSVLRRVDGDELN